MREFKEKNIWRSMIYSRVVLVLLVVLIFVTLRGSLNLYQKSEETALRRQSTEKRLSDLQKREVFLETEIASLSTPGGIDEEVRQKFNVKKDGEEVAIIVKDDKKDDNIISEQNGFVSRAFGWVKGVFGM